MEGWEKKMKSAGSRAREHGAKEEGEGRKEWE